MAYLSQELYGTDDPTKLTEDQKKTLTAFDTLIMGAVTAGLSAATGGNTPANIAAGAQGAQSATNEAANNWLSGAQWKERYKDAAKCAQGDQTACQGERVLDRVNKLNQEQLSNACDPSQGGDPNSVACNSQIAQALDNGTNVIFRDAMGHITALPKDWVAVNSKGQVVLTINGTSISSNGQATSSDTVSDGSKQDGFEQQVAGSIDSSLAGGVKMFLIDPAVSIGVGGEELFDGEYGKGAVDVASGVLALTPIGKVGIGTDAGKAALEGANEANIAGKTFENAAGSQSLQKGAIIENIPAGEIRFSQNTVSYNKVDRITGVPYTYDDILNSMKTNGWQGEPVDVVEMPDGELTSLDNTRILAARNAGINVKVNVRAYDAPLTSAEIVRFTKTINGQPRIPKTWGEAVSIRIESQTGKFSVKNPLGTNTVPKITGMPK